MVLSAYLAPFALLPPTFFFGLLFFLVALGLIVHLGS